MAKLKRGGLPPETFLRQQLGLSRQLFDAMAVGNVHLMRAHQQAAMLVLELGWRYYLEGICVDMPRQYELLDNLRWLFDHPEVSDTDSRLALLCEFDSESVVQLIDFARACAGVSLVKVTPVQSSAAGESALIASSAQRFQAQHWQQFSANDLARLLSTTEALVEGLSDLGGEF